MKCLSVSDPLVKCYPSVYLMFAFLLRLTVLQYGFVTMFVAAFPLGPLFALLNSIVEIRVDAINFVSQFRRPDSARAEDIGAWFRILEGVTKVSVLVNAFVLAFTSEYIPKLIYKMKYSNGTSTLEGYIDNSLATINVTYIFLKEPGTAPEDPNENLPNQNITTCRLVGVGVSVASFPPSLNIPHPSTALS